MHTLCRACARAAAIGIALVVSLAAAGCHSDVDATAAHDAFALSAGARKDASKAAAPQYIGERFSTEQSKLRDAPAEAPPAGF